MWGLVSPLLTIAYFSGAALMNELLCFVKSNGDFFVGVATLIGPLLAAGVAAWAALSAFPKQMNAQRNLEWHRDKRARFGDFLGTLDNVLLLDVATLTNSSPQILSLNGSLGVLEVTSTDAETIKAAKSVVRLVNNWMTDQRPVPVMTQMMRNVTDSLMRGSMMGLDFRRSQVESARNTLIEKMQTELKEMQGK